MNGAAMGLLGGFGRGVSMVADDMQKSNLFAQQEQAAMAREQRIEEAAIAREGRQEQYNINSEKRGIENSRVKAQNEIDLKTNPDNINKLTQAELMQAKAKDEYSDTRLSKDVERAGAIANATRGPDHTDYAGRALDNRLKKMQIAEYSNPGRLSKTEKEAIDYYSDENKQIWKQRKDLLDLAQEADEAKSKQYTQEAERLQIQYKANEQRIAGLRKGEVSIHESQGSTNSDPSALIEEISQLSPGYNFPDKLSSIKDLEDIRDSLKLSKQNTRSAKDDKEFEDLDKASQDKSGLLGRAINNVKETASSLVKTQEVNKDVMDKARSILLNGSKSLGAMPDDPEEAYKYKRQVQAINYALNSDMGEDQKLGAIYRLLLNQ